MPASTETLVFGPEEDADSEVIVPHFIVSGKPSDLHLAASLFLTIASVKMTGSASAAFGI